MGDTIEVAQFSDWMRRYAGVIHENAAMLTELDSAIGDADHGSNMDRGMSAVVAALEAGEFASGADLFKKIGMTLVSSVGGASGPLYGTFFLRFGGKLGDGPVDAQALGVALRAGVEGIVQRGKAEVGDKTMIDAWAPALEAYDAAAPDGLDAALRAAAEAGAGGRDAATPLVARKGRASYLGERSAGHQDPGATSSVLLLEAAAATLA
ncbi:dihydroxyacetone kinase subunit L [Flexivirga endophytica]|uniref:Dihydroxyacetone kinase subunit L n=1 Tax=Flexivirga endophytica TaxID=1849103 RepID=A0A916T2P0_9MICO|nr:dihydroxyacetone kinase subunit DhaL [Flexivirga endophytica]GGB29140.1 dihydroxyacetone kinase subunit L [Flexivirga endophytica]GHB50222.1 dihydroxyacetone kinase subunit L [Flexivirga endophytica]